MTSIFLGAYWGARAESREAAASKIASFLIEAGNLDEGLSCWLKKGMSRKKANARIELTVTGVSASMRTNNRDVDNLPINELGYNFNAWNGKNADVAIHIAAYDSSTPNSLVLDSDPVLSESIWRQLCELAIQIFDPDDVVVTSSTHIASRGGAGPVEAGGWFTYRRGNPLQQHPFNQDRQAEPA
jgi:hypothetical protein